MIAEGLGARFPPRRPSYAPSVSSGASPLCAIGGGLARYARSTFTGGLTMCRQWVAPKTLAQHPASPTTLRFGASRFREQRRHLVASRNGWASARMSPMGTADPRPQSLSRPFAGRAAMMTARNPVLAAFAAAVEVQALGVNQRRSAEGHGTVRLWADFCGRNPFWVGDQCGVHRVNPGRSPESRSAIVAVGRRSSDHLSLYPLDDLVVGRPSKRCRRSAILRADESFPTQSPFNGERAKARSSGSWLRLCGRGPIAETD